MPFPLADWIDGHADCHHNLAISGMIGSVPPPIPSPREVRSADEAELRAQLASDLGVNARRVFLATGASQANSLAILFLARQHRGASVGACRVCYPEYPPLFDTARQSGFRLTESLGPAELAVLSQPRNPEGDLWDRARFLDWTTQARSVIVDETFREFSESRSFLGTDRPGLWSTGSLTKFFAADDLRVGFVVAPEESALEFARFHGLVANKLARYSVAGAVRALRDREKTRRRVRSILRANIAALRQSFPGIRPPEAPLLFDRLETGEDGDRLARRALTASVLVCSGTFFGDRSGVRLCLTRPSFRADLAAYRRVRDFPRGRTRSPVRPPA